MADFFPKTGNHAMNSANFGAKVGRLATNRVLSDRLLVLIITYVRPYQVENGHKKTEREEGNDQCEPPPERQGNHGKKGFEAWGPRGLPLRKSESHTQIMHDSVHPPFPLPPVACTCASSWGSVPDRYTIVASYTLGEPSQS